MHASDIMDITIAVEKYMKGRNSSPNVFNVVNALDKLGYLIQRNEIGCAVCGRIIGNNPWDELQHLWAEPDTSTKKGGKK